MASSADGFLMGVKMHDVGMQPTQSDNRYRLISLLGLVDGSASFPGPVEPQMENKTKPGWLICVGDWLLQKLSSLFDYIFEISRFFQPFLGIPFNQPIQWGCFMALSCQIRKSFPLETIHQIDPCAVSKESLSARQQTPFSTNQFGVFPVPILQLVHCLSYFFAWSKPSYLVTLPFSNISGWKIHESSMSCWK